MTAVNEKPVLSGASTLPPMEPEPTVGTGTELTTQKTKRARKRVSGDRFGVLNSFVDCSIAGLSKAEIATWLILYRDTRNGTARTAQSDIAKRAGLDVRTIRRAIRKLEAAGLLVVVFKGSLNSGPSRYRILPIRQ